MNLDEVHACTGASDKAKFRCVATPAYLPAIQMRDSGGVPIAVETPMMKPESFGIVFESTHTEAILCDLHHNVFCADSVVFAGRRFIHCSERALGIDKNFVQASLCQ